MDGIKNTNFQLENLKVIDYLKDIDVDGRIILSGVIWLRIGIRGELL
jgi:hypothetical protein